MGADSVLVSIVTFNDEPFLQRCLESVRAQTVPVRVRVWDNASEDGSAATARRCGAEVFESPANVGFCAGHNGNLEAAGSEFALICNADIVLGPEYLEVLLEVMRQLPRCGLAGGKLLRMDPEGRLILSRGAPLIDSTGIYFTPSFRHFDRGSGDEDRGQYQRTQEVFGITGAALLLRREMVPELGFGRQCFDEDFFAYREDADLAWRARLRGWQAIYEPRATARHYRQVLPSRRRQLSPVINYHSVKNRYLMRMKNADAAVRRRCFPYGILRDAGILLYVLLLEWSSIPALWQVWRLRKKYRDKRSTVQDRRRAAPEELAPWFSFEPTAKDVEPLPDPQS